MEEKYTKLIEIMKNPDEAKRLLSLDPEDAVKVFSEEYKLDFSLDELNDVAAGIRDELKENSSAELTSADLENVTGGGKRAYNAGRTVGRIVQLVGVVVGIGSALGW